MRSSYFLTYPVNIVPDSAVSLVNSFVLSAVVGNFCMASSRMARWPSTEKEKNTKQVSLCYKVRHLPSVPRRR